MQANKRPAFRSRFEEGAVAIRVSGPVTLSTLRTLRAEIAAGVMMSDAKRVLCDFRGAVVLLGDDDWQAYAKECTSVHALAISQGLLVGSEAAEHARAFCDCLNAHGRVALAFFTSQDAYRWLGVPALLNPQVAPSATDRC